jgi:hypothetical protein
MIIQYFIITFLNIVFKFRLIEIIYYYIKSKYLNHKIILLSCFLWFSNLENNKNIKNQNLNSVFKFIFIFSRMAYNLKINIHDNVLQIVIG